MNEITGVVLCGGAGRRMGADKALLRVKGRPLVAVVAERLGALAEPVLIASGRRRIPDLTYEQLTDARDDAGPLGGIVAGLRSLRTPLLAVVAVDMPYVNVALLSLLAGVRVEEDAVVPVDRHGPQPLHAIYARSALGPAEDALSEGTLSMRAFLGRLNVRYVPPDQWRDVDPHGRFAFNINSPSDLATLDSTESLRNSDG